MHPPVHCSDNLTQRVVIKSQGKSKSVNTAVMRTGNTIDDQWSSSMTNGRQPRWMNRPHMRRDEGPTDEERWPMEMPRFELFTHHFGQIFGIFLPLFSWFKVWFVNRFKITLLTTIFRQ